MGEQGGVAGDLGKHHRISEELIELGVITLHTDNNAVAYAKIQAAPLHRAIERFAAEAEAAKQQQAGRRGGRRSGSSSSICSGGALCGQTRRQGLQNGRRSRLLSRRPRRRGEATAAQQRRLHCRRVGARHLAEGYTYYWHTPTSTSSWEVPTGEPRSAKTMSLSAHVAHSLTNDRGVAVRKIEAVRREYTD